MSEDPVYTEDEERMFCAWSDYRSEYGVSALRMSDAHADFTAGWEAARDSWTIDVSKHTMDWRAGFDAFFDDLDIGGVMR